MMCLGEVLGLGFDWESDGVGFEEGGLPNGKVVVVQWVVGEGIHDNEGRIIDKDWGEEWTKVGGRWVRVLEFF